MIRFIKKIIKCIMDRVLLALKRKGNGLSVLASAVSQYVNFDTAGLPSVVDSPDGDAETVVSVSLTSFSTGVPPIGTQGAFNISYAIFPNRPYYIFGDGAGNDYPFSFSFWMENNNNAWQYILFCATAGTSNIAYYVQKQGSNKLALVLCSGGTESNRIQKVWTIGTGHLNNNTHFAFTYDGSGTPEGFNLYENGVLMETFTTATVGTYAGQPNHTGKFRISANFSNSQLLKGYIDEFYIFNKALSQEEVSVVYNKYIAQETII